MKTVTIGQVIEALSQDQGSPLDAGELDQIENVLTTLDYDIGNGDQEISYEEWLTIQQTPEFAGLFNQVPDATVLQRHVTGSIQLMFAQAGTTQQSRRNVSAENISFTPQQDLGQMSEEQISEYVETQLDALHNQDTPLSTRLYHAEVAAKLLLKAGLNDEAGTLYSEMAGLSPKGSYQTSADSALAITSANEAYFETQSQLQNAQTTMVTLLLCAQVVADWIAQGEKYKDSWTGTAENFWFPEWSSSHYFDETKPLLIEFLKKWEYLAATGDFKSTLNIFAEISNGGSQAGEGCNIFMDLVFNPGGKHNLGYTHHYAVQQFIEAEKITYPAQKSHAILESTNRWLLTNGESYGAAYAIGDLFKDDPDESELAQQVMRHAEAQPNFDTLCHIVNPENPLLLVAGLTGAVWIKRILALGLATDASVLAKFVTFGSLSLGAHAVLVGGIIVADSLSSDNVRDEPDEQTAQDAEEDIGNSETDNPTQVEAIEDDPEVSPEEKQKSDTAPQRPANQRSWTSPTHQSASELQTDVRSTIQDVSGTVQPTELDPLKRAKNRRSHRLQDVTAETAVDQTQEPEYLKAIRETESGSVDGAKLKTREQLIQEAQDALMEFGHSGRVNFDYAGFFIQSELGDDGSTNSVLLEPLTKAMIKLVDETRTAVLAEQTDQGKIEALRRTLISHYIKFYSRGFAKLTDFLKGSGGNCEAETKMFLAVMSAIQFSLPRDTVLGVQLFRDHVQPVLYNKTSGQVTELVSGAVINDVCGPIYAPPVLFHAWLKGHGVAPSLDLDSMLIAGRNSDYGKNFSSPAYGSNTSLSFDGGESYYADGPVPDSAFIGMQGMHPVGMVSGGSDRNDITLIWPPEYTGSQESPLSKNEIIKISESGLFVTFERKSDYDLCKSLSVTSNADEADCILFLTKQKLSIMLESKDVQRAILALRDPSRINKISPEEISRLATISKAIEDVISNTACTMLDLFPMKYGLGADLWGDKRDYATKKLRNDLQMEMPVLSVLQTEQNNLRNRIAAKPLDFLRFIDKLDSKKRTAFFDFIGTTDSKEIDPHGYEGDAIRPILELVANPALVGTYEEAPGLHAEDYIMVSFVDDPNTPPVPPVSGDGVSDRRVAGDDKDDSARDWANEIPPQIYISEQCLLEILLKYAEFQIRANTETKTQGLYLDNRWTPNISKLFLAFNDGGQYDEFFLQNYYHFRGHQTSRGWEKRTPLVSDPYVEYQMSLCGQGTKGEMQNNMMPCRGNMEMMGGKEDERLVPQDLVPILQAIVERKKKTEAGAPPNEGDGGE